MFKIHPFIPVIPSGMIELAQSMTDSLKGVDVKVIFENLGKVSALGSNALRISSPHLAHYLIYEVFNKEFKRSLFIRTENLTSNLATSDSVQLQKSLKDYREELDSSLKLRLFLPIVDLSIVYDLLNEISQLDRFGVCLTFFSVKVALSWFFYFFGVLDQTPDAIYHLYFNYDFITDLIATAALLIKIVALEATGMFYVLPLFFLLLRIGMKIQEINKYGMNFFVIPRKNDRNEYSLLKSWKFKKLCSETGQNISQKVSVLRAMIPGFQELRKDYQYTKAYWFPARVR